MHLHFLVPGLLWPNEYYKAALKDIRLPTLSALLGRGQRQWQKPVSREDWLAQHFGLAPAPFAALRLAGEEMDDNEAGTTPCPHPLSLRRGEHREPLRGFRKPGNWLCADPVQLSFTQQSLMLADAGTLDLSMEEARAVIESLNQEFPDLGQFHAAAPERWYLSLAKPAALSTHRLAKVVGRRVDRFLPEGPDGPAWRRHFNEIQVLLHTHPVNAAREAAGRPRVNSVWFWGEGSLPAANPSPLFDAVMSNDILARGFARQAGITPLPSDASPGNARHTLAMLDSLYRPALYSDLDAWCTALVALEAEKLAPALASLKAGRISTLSLTALGDRASLSLTLQRRDLWKFWRSPSPITALDIPDLSGEEAA